MRNDFVKIQGGTPPPPLVSLRGGAWNHLCYGLHLWYFKLLLFDQTEWFEISEAHDIGYEKILGLVCDRLNFFLLQNFQHMNRKNVVELARRIQLRLLKSSLAILLVETKHVRFSNLWLVLAFGADLKLVNFRASFFENIKKIFLFSLQKLDYKNFQKSDSRIFALETKQELFRM